MNCSIINQISWSHIANSQNSNYYGPYFTKVVHQIFRLHYHYSAFLPTHHFSSYKLSNKWMSPASTRQSNHFIISYRSSFISCHFSTFIPPHSSFPLLHHSLFLHPSRSSHYFEYLSQYSILTSQYYFTQTSP